MFSQIAPLSKEGVPTYFIKSCGIIYIKLCNSKYMCRSNTLGDCLLFSSKALFQWWREIERSHKKLKTFLIFEDKVGCHKIFTSQSPGKKKDGEYASELLKGYYRNYEKQHYRPHLETKVLIWAWRCVTQNDHDL